MNSTQFLGVLCLIKLSQDIGGCFAVVCPGISPTLYIIYITTYDFDFYWIPTCAKTFDSAFICTSCLWLFFFFGCFVLFWFVFVLYYKLCVHLLLYLRYHGFLKRERVQIQMSWKEGRTVRSRGKGKHCQTILYEKYYFQ